VALLEVPWSEMLAWHEEVIRIGGALRLPIMVPSEEEE